VAAKRDFKACSCFLGDFDGLGSGGDISRGLSDDARLLLSSDTNVPANVLNSAAACDDSDSN
jgi:hypothetical protein